METDRLKYFTVVAEMGSLTKAAKILGISHSGLSKAVSSLEHEAKLKLFRPQGRGLEITPEGKWFYQKALEILKVVSEMQRGQVKRHSLVRVGLSGVIAMTCAGKIVEELDCSVLLTEIDVGEVEGKIISGDLDFGLAFIPSPKPELEYLEVGDVVFNSFAREDLIRKAPSSQLPFAVPISEFPLNPLGYRNRDGWPKDIPRMPHFFVSGFAIALDLLRSGQAAIYMPDFAARLENDATKSGKFLSVKAHAGAETRRRLFLVKRQASEESKEMRRVAKVVRRICCSKC